MQFFSDLFSWLFRRRKKKETQEDGKEQKYTYKYMAYPFAHEWCWFHVQATNQEEADDRAREEFRRLHDAGYTVMGTFYPVTR